MDELIQQLVSKLGIDADTATAASGKAMAMVKAQTGDDLFAKVSGAIPGAETAAEMGAAEPAQQASKGGGLLGSITGMASGMLGGSAGGAIGLASALGSTGLKADQLGGFATTIVGFLRAKVGDDVVEQILAKVPMLKSLAG